MNKIMAPLIFIRIISSLLFSSKTQQIRPKKLATLLLHYNHLSSQ